MKEEMEGMELPCQVQHIKLLYSYMQCRQGTRATQLDGYQILPGDNTNSLLDVGCFFSFFVAFPNNQDSIFPRKDVLSAPGALASCNTMDPTSRN